MLSLRGRLLRGPVVLLSLLVVLNLLYATKIQLRTVSVSWVYRLDLARLDPSVDATVSVDRHSIVIVVPGHGDAKRLPQLKETLDALRLSALSQRVGFECLVYVWKEALLGNTARQLDKCLVLPSHGLWTHHMLKVGLNESRAIVANSTHVSILMDDVNARSVNLPRFLDTMERANFTVAAPSLVDFYRSAFPRPYCMAHTTQFTDVLFTTFTRPQWEIFQRHINTTLNANGWGYDITLADVCNATIGVIDHEQIYHQAARNNARSYSATTARQELRQWLETHMPPSRHYRNVDSYYKFVTLERPRALPYCRDVAFHASKDNHSGDLSVVNHVSGHSAFVATIASAAHTEKRSKNANQPRSIELIGSIDDWFGVSRVDTVRMDKWVGFFHSQPSAIQSAGFFNSAPHCVALLAYTTTMARAVAKHLNDTGIQNVSVCAVQYPIQHVSVNCTSVDATLMDWKPTLSKAPLTALVLWEQPFSRVASLHALATKRQKIWLTSAFNARNTTPAELTAANVTRDATVQIRTASTPNEMAQMTQRSIILVDTWADGSYEAAVYALKWNAPFLVRKLSGYVEYLGEDYPLFFTSLDEVQTLLNDEALLQREMLEAHEYLKARDTSAFTLDHLSRQVAHCTLAALADWNHD